MGVPWQTPQRTAPSILIQLHVHVVQCTHKSTIDVQMLPYLYVYSPVMMSADYNYYYTEIICITNLLLLLLLLYTLKLTFRLSLLSLLLLPLHGTVESLILLVLPITITPCSDDERNLQIAESETSLEACHWTVKQKLCT